MCPLGSYCPPGTSQATQFPCPLGTSGGLPGVARLEDCSSTECPSGFYCLPGTAAGKGCPSGTYSTITGLARADQCEDIECPAGSYCPTGTSYAREYLCPAGKYSSLNGIARSEQCENLPCPAGHWCEAGTSNATKYDLPCPIGKYGVPTNGHAYEATACSLCDGGKRANGATGAIGEDNACVECEPGKTSAAGSPLCYYTCAMGEYMSNISASGCASCPPGFYSTELGLTDIAQCTRCEIGYFCERGYKRLACPAGKWSNDAGAESSETCQPCAKGKYSGATGLDSQDKCNDCSPGKRGITEGAMSIADGCTDCEAGRFASVSGMTECHECSSGSSKPGSSYCSDCTAGTMLDRSLKPASCVPCAVGTISGPGDGICNVCPAGKFESNERTSCSLCPEGRWSAATGATSIATCLPCAKGTYSGATGLDAAQKCNECPPGKHGDTLGSISVNQGCKDCSAGTYTSSGGQHQCTQCVKGLTYQHKTGQAFALSCSKCPPGKRETIACSDISDTQCATCSAGSRSRNDGQACVACENGKVSEQESATCEVCAEGHYANDANTNCVPCESGYQCSGGLRTRCTAGTMSAKASANCKRCEAGSYENGKRTKCVKCAAGTASIVVGAAEADTCLPCPHGTFGTVDRRTCTQCPGGRWSNREGAVGIDTCVKCGTGKFSAALGAFSESMCNDCPGGVVSTIEGAKSCSERTCPAGQRSNDAGTECEGCGAGETSGEGESSCSLCPQGTYADEDHAECLHCEPGFRCSAGVRVACGDGTYSTGSQATCLVCAPGTYGVSDHKACQKCSPGRWGIIVGAKDATVCSPCQAGTYGTIERRACAQCGKGKWSAAMGATSEATCLECVVGKFSAALGAAVESVCNICPGGRSSGVPGASACEVKCKAGTMSVSNGTMCVACDKGTFSASASASCAACEPGYVPNLDQTSCRSCTAGTFAAQGESSCAKCPLGYYSTSGAGGCNSCGAGRYGNIDQPKTSEASHCTPCEVGRFSAALGAADASMCNSCPPGKRGTTIGATSITKGCRDCDTGTFTAEGGQTHCTKCEVGDAWQDKPGQAFETKCSVCQPGRYERSACNAVTDSKCEDCSAGRFASQSGMTECELCVGGSSEAGSSYCEQCLPGKYLTIEHGNPECRDCKAGYFAENVGMTKCAKCASGTSDRGSSYCSDCEAGTALDWSRQPPVCTKCAPGWVSAAGQPCEPCEVGTYANPTQTDCLGCEAGRFGNASGLTDAACSGACPAPGSYSTRYAVECTPIDVGYTADVNVQTGLSTGPKRCTGDHQTTLARGSGVCVCEAEYYAAKDGTCTPCIEGVDCTQPGATLATLDLKPSFWRPSTTSVSVIECPAPQACVGGANVSDAACKEGNEGMLCAVCIDGFYRPSRFKPCKVCGSKESAIATAVGAGVGGIVVLYIFVYFNRRAPSGMLRPFINLVQQLTVMLTFNAPFPKVLTDLGRVLAGVSLGVDVVSPQCAGFGSSFYTRFGMLVAMVVVIALLLLSRLFYMRLSKCSSTSFRKILNSPEGAAALRDLFVVVLLLHPGVSGRAMEFFRCREIGGKVYLMADYAQRCYDGTWFTYLPLVAAVLAFFSIGTPAAIYWVLRKRRDSLYHEDGTVNPQSLDILYAVYRREAYFYESVQMLFKLGLWSTLVFFKHGSEMQLGAALVINVMQLCIHQTVLPMGGKDATLLNFMLSGMNYLKVSIGAFPDRKAELSAHIDRLQIVMQILTFGLVLSFCGVAIKNAYSTARHTDFNDVRKRVGSVAIKKITSPKASFKSFKHRSSDSSPAQKNSIERKSGIELTISSPSQLGSSPNGKVRLHARRSSAEEVGALPSANRQQADDSML